MAPEETSYCKNGVSIKKLRRSRLRVGDELDLHGMTSIEAEKMLHDFLHSAKRKGINLVRIIHGKGYNSKDGVAVLKPLCKRLLAEEHDVLAFHEAGMSEGGSGALLVYLRSS